jgi:hypothetical protein
MQNIEELEKLQRDKMGKVVGQRTRIHWDRLEATFKYAETLGLV